MFEYKTVSINVEGFFGIKMDMVAYEDMLNDMGRKGWELMNSYPISYHEGATAQIISVFKRKLS